MNDRADPTPTEPVRFERDARGVDTLTLNRPQSFNALSEAMLAALQAVARPAALDVQGEVVPPGDAATSTDGTAQWRFVLSRSVDTRGWAADGRFSLHGVTLAVRVREAANWAAPMWRVNG